MFQYELIITKITIMMIINIYVSTQYQPGTELVFTLSSQLYERGISYSIDDEIKVRRADNLEMGSDKVHIEQELAQVHKIPEPISQRENSIWPSPQHATITTNNILSHTVLPNLI